VHALIVRLTDSTMRGKSDQLFKDASSAWDSGDLGRAFELFSQAAEAGDASCQLNLGYFYDCGLHVPRDERLARRWYLQAYRQGEASAASNIATLYRDAHDYGRMIWWWRAAIRMGDGDALLELGRCYESGRGVPIDRDRAADYYVRLLASPHTTETSREAAEDRLRQLRSLTSRHPQPA
jgi:uncharacterized protein